MFVFCLGRCRSTIDLELVMLLRGGTEGRCCLSTVAMLVALQRLFYVWRNGGEMLLVNCGMMLRPSGTD